MKEFLNIKTLEDTKKAAIDILQVISSYNLVCLYGNLGSGKTTFSKYLIEAVTGISTVTSPTFNIMQLYEGNNNTAYHYDLYRLKSAEEIFELGLLEQIELGIVIIEWPEIAEKYLPKSRRINIKLELKANNIRSLMIEYV